MDPLSVLSYMYKWLWLYEKKKKKLETICSWYHEGWILQHEYEPNVHSHTFIRLKL